MNLRVLGIGDVVGKPGRKALAEYLPGFIKEHGVHLVVANIENAAGGFGPDLKTMEELLTLPIHVFTAGSHVWDKKEFSNALDLYPMVLRPANYPPGNPGRGHIVWPLPDGRKVAVVQLEGRVFMDMLDCPFRALDSLLAELPPEVPLLVDFHGEATSEKQAFGHYADGRAAAVWGTHTHVPTADARVLPGGTAFITDVGMTGAYDSVIGFDKEVIVGRFLRQAPVRFEVARAPGHLAAALIDIDFPAKRATAIRHVLVPPL